MTRGMKAARAQRTASFRLNRIRVRGQKRDDVNSPNTSHNLCVDGFPGTFGDALLRVLRTSKANFGVGLAAVKISSVGRIVALASVVSPAANHSKGCARREVQRALGVSTVDLDFIGHPFPCVADHIKRSHWTCAVRILANLLYTRGILLRTDLIRLLTDVGNACSPFISPGINSSFRAPCGRLPFNFSG